MDFGADVAVRRVLTTRHMPRSRCCSGDFRCRAAASFGRSPTRRARSFVDFRDDLRLELPVAGSISAAVLVRVMEAMDRQVPEKTPATAARSNPCAKKSVMKKTCGCCAAGLT